MKRREEKEGRKGVREGRKRQSNIQAVNWNFPKFKKKKKLILRYGTSKDFCHFKTVINSFLLGLYLTEDISFN